MPFSIKRPVFAHGFINPPLERRTCDITIKINNPVNEIDLIKESSGSQTKICLEIKDSSLLGLSDSELSNADKIVHDLVLAFNLSLSRICLSMLNGDLPLTETNLILPKINKIIEEKITPKGKSLIIHDSVHFVDSVSVMMGIPDELNEKQALDYFRLLHKINRQSLNPPNLKEANIGKALNEFENAMSVFDTLRIFKYLFNTLEFCANYTGTDLKGPTLDFVIASKTHFPQPEIENWRQFYNRTKHVDKTPKDTTKFFDDSNKLIEILPKIREAAKIMLLDCLGSM